MRIDMMLLSRQLISKRFNSQWQKLGRCYKRLPEKLSLITDYERQKSRTIRCGVILPSCTPEYSSFLSVLLADVYTSDRSWFYTLASRHNREGDSCILMKYGRYFDLQKLGTATILTLPSPFLKGHDVEFLEFQQNDANKSEKQLERECHFYVDFSGGSSQAWPTINLQNSKKHSVLPVSNIINSDLALKATINFMKDKSTVNQYLRDMTSSNFETTSKKLGLFLDDKEIIVRNLKHSVIQNLKRIEDLSSEKSIINLKKLRMMEDINNWSELAHMELQTVIIPVINKFIKDQLSIWRIYTYSESKFRLRLIQLLIEPLDELKMNVNLYKLSGKLNVSDSVPLRSPGQRECINNKVLGLHKKGNQTVYRNFFDLQLPLILCSVLGALTQQFSVYSMGSLASLGIILGFRRVVSTWDETMKSISHDITENIRKSIENDKALLLEHCKKHFLKEENQYEEKLRLMECISKELNEL